MRRTRIRRLRGAALVAFAVAVTGGGIVVTNQGGGVAAGTANLWWDQNGGTCTRSATPVAYNDAAACLPPRRTSPEGSSMAGWDNAQTGDLILVVDAAGGNDYGDLTLSGETKTVTIRAASGTPEFARVVVACDNCTLENLKFEGRGDGIDADEYWVCNEISRSDFVSGIVAACGATGDYINIEVDGLDTGCPPAGYNFNYSQFHSATNGIRIIGGSIHGIRDNKGVDGGMRFGLIEDVDFYDISRPNVCAADVHNECLWLGEIEGTTIRNSSFLNCPTQALFISDLGTPVWDGFTLEGNVFAHATEGTKPYTWHGSPITLNVGQEVQRNWTIRYNTFETAPAFSSVTGSTGNVWYGNAGGAACGLTGWTYHHNVGETCGGANSVATNPSVNTATSPSQVPWYVDAPAGNFHLTAGAAPIGAGDPAAFPATDRDGVVRTNPPDAGAYERP